MIFWPLKLALKILSAIISVVVLYYGITVFQVWNTSRLYSPHHADALVVMGTASGYNGIPGPVLKARLDEALVLFQTGQTKVLVVTGGKLKGDLYTEAQASASYLEGKGVPTADILQAGGADSYQNIAYAAPAMRARHIRTVLCVTDPFHEDRSMAILSTFNFTPTPTPTQTSPIKGTATIKYFAREGLAVSLGRIIGYGNLSALTTWFH